MTWAVAPDGFYYQNLTVHGLSAVLGGIMHVLFNQYSGSLDTCAYSGLLGQGTLSFNSAQVYLILAILGIVLLIYSIQVVVAFSINRVREKNVFKHSATILRKPEALTFYLTRWIGAYKNSDDRAIDEIMSEESKLHALF